MVQPVTCDELPGWRKDDKAAARAAYIAMARLTADRAMAAGTLPAERAADLLDVLAEPPGGGA